MASRSRLVYWLPWLLLVLGVLQIALGIIDGIDTLRIISGVILFVLVAGLLVANARMSKRN